MEWLSGLLRLIGIGKSNVAGWDRLTDRQNEWIDRIEKRLDDCDEDRAELHKRADECDEDRQELREQVAGLKDKFETLEENTRTQ